MAMLEVTGLEAGYGDLKVLYGIDLTVEEGETAVLLGLNGAGKTTTMLCLAGLMQPWGGSISVAGDDVTKADAKEMVSKQVVLSPEGRRVFPALSVDQNLNMGAWVKRKDTEFVEQKKAEVYGYFPRLDERREQLAGTLSGGEQQMLAVARAMMGDPKLLLIDEMSLGLAPVIVTQLFEIIADINKGGLTVILVEQNVGALKVADRAFVMEKGTIKYQAVGKEVRDAKKLRNAYLGT